MHHGVVDPELAAYIRELKDTRGIEMYITEGATLEIVKTVIENMDEEHRLAEMEQRYGNS